MTVNDYVFVNSTQAKHYDFYLGQLFDDNHITILSMIINGIFYFQVAKPKESDNNKKTEKKDPLAAENCKLL